MSITRESIGQQELRYFGRVTASVSHELKNVLAIMNEHAGLLQDYVAMAERGQPLDPERIRKLSAAMAKQVGRGDIIIKRMNRFAHSADKPLAQVDLHELVSMVVELFGRTAATRGITIEIKSTESCLLIETDCFALETLLGNLLDQLTEQIPDIGTITVDLSSYGSAGEIRMTGFAGYCGVIEDLLALDHFSVLLSALNAKAGISQQSGELFIALSGDSQLPGNGK